MTRVFALIKTTVMQMEYYVFTNHRSSGRPPGEVIPPWLVLTVDYRLFESPPRVVMTKLQAGAVFNLSWLVCLLEADLCFGIKLCQDIRECLKKVVLS